ncbi:hypothetical protein CLV45_3204 [Hymenobacter chitinivorans DSM 11115]|uniref:NHL repeat-containing protein n=1 Tax=Hymenobacter chitinivorans DSM 11115 TaxID=1121954 RepID=A0A2M9BA85_9BACT|nr:hypothetical protein CLV45_3204 [Hymenobacter chitinivorans DSM 11115]
MNWHCGTSSRMESLELRGKYAEPNPQHLELGHWLRPLILGLVLSSNFSALTFAQTTVPPAASVVPAGKPAASAPAPVVNAAAQTAPVADANGWTLTRTIALAQPGPASVDRRGNLYVADNQNNVRQFGPDGQALNTYSPPQPGNTAQIEAWNTAKVLVFYDDRQQILLLDRFMAPLTQFRLPDMLDGLVRTATLAPDDRLWLLDESNLALRQYDPAGQRMVVSTQMDLLIGRSKPDFRFMRQYQNNLYLVDRSSGIYVFDNLGNYRKKLPFPGLSSIGFRNDELYYLADNAVHFFHLYNLTDRTLPLPAGPADVRQVLLGEQFAYVLTSAGVLVYKL